jgi:hypothetical protein
MRSSFIHSFIHLPFMRRQHIYLSMACRNPRRGLMCEPPAIKRIDFYCHSDLSLAGFIVAAAPHAQKKCQVRAMSQPTLL